MFCVQLLTSLRNNLRATDTMKFQCERPEEKKKKNTTCLIIRISISQRGKKWMSHVVTDSRSGPIPAHQGKALVSDKKPVWTIVSISVATRKLRGAVVVNTAATPRWYYDLETKVHGLFFTLLCGSLNMLHWIHTVHTERSAKVKG